MTELNKVNQCYKQIIVDAVKLKKENETRMMYVEAERVMSTENDRVYDLAMQEKNESSTLLSQGRVLLVSVSNIIA